MLNKENAYKIIDKVLSYCNYYTLVTVSSDEEGLTRFANSEIHQNVFSANNVVSVAVYKGKKESKVTTNLLSDEGLRQAVLDAEENLKFLPEGDIEIPELLEPKEIACEDYDCELDLKFDIPKRAELIKAGIDKLEDGFIAAGALSNKKMVISIGNNRGVKRYGRTDTINFNVVVIHESGSSGYSEYSTNAAGELDVLSEFERAYKKAKMGIDPVSMEPGSYTVILEPLAVSDLLSYMSYCGFSARSAQIGTGYLTGKLGQKVFGENITITDDTENSNTFPLYFDFEGYKREKLNIIEKGFVRELAYDTRSAIKDGVRTTGHSIGDTSIGGFPINLIIEGGNDTLEGMVKSIKKGILVTRFHYMNIVDPRQAVLTALTRDGLFLIENGEIKCGVKNMRFTESMLNAFSNVTSITSERKKTPGFFGVNYVPTLRIENFHFTGKTE